MVEIWILLIAAHVYGDFVLQTDKIAANKSNPLCLLLHASTHGVLAYLVLQQWTFWPLLFAVALVHGLIDFVKLRSGSGSTAFAVDQLVHGLTLAAIAWVLAQTGLLIEGIEGVAFGKEIVIGAGFVASVWGAGFYVGKIADEMTAGNSSLRDELSKGLRGGGATIGKLERALIFFFVAIGQPTGIGFLVAAKSILRFEEAKKQPLAEYVLIGTLWSFGLALFLATITFHLTR